MIDSNSVFTRSDFSGLGAVIAAVSGGSDSLAMLFLLRDYLIRNNWQKRLIAVTVDHGLRDTSAQEALYVGQLCAAHNIEHDIFIWDDEKPENAVSCKARIARYDLLCRAAEKYRADVIVTGHTLDDQAETYIMRSVRGTGRGLAAMPRLAVLQQKFCLLRPLLGIRRQKLRYYLGGWGLAWVDDPGNDNLLYERVKIRKSMDDQTVLCTRQAVFVAAQARRAASAAVAALALRLHMRLQGEQLCLSLALLDPDDMTALENLVVMAAAIMGGARYPAFGRQGVKDFLAQKKTRLRRLTLSGSVIEMTEKFLRIWREKRNLETLVLEAGHTAIWDGRYRVGNSSGDSVILRSPSRKELQWLIQNTKQNRYGERILHFPSLETTCLICGQGGINLPVLTPHLLQKRNISFRRIMLPFDWLFSGYDIEMFWAFHSVFTINTGKITKTGQNCHDLDARILATLQSEHMLHGNLTGAPVPFG